ncbi:MAG TPA: hypothetical protein VKA41_11780 [Solirubrobacterales bacterium]|nr:hypothetical protein [Solirubrobacterales bacterium]
MRLPGTGLVVFVVVCAGLAGCGGGDGGSDSPAERAAQEYVDAYNDRDFDRVCELLSESYKESLLTGEGEEAEEEPGCPEWFEEHTSGVPTTLTLVDVSENGNQATAHIRSQAEDTPAAENDLALRIMRQPSGVWQITDLTTFASTASP